MPASLTVHGVRDHVREVYRLRAERNLASSNATHIEEIIHQANHVAYLPRDHVRGVILCFRLRRKKAA